jgi:hypothetical protein
MNCKFPGCDHDVFTAGLCHGHYAQKRRGAELAPLHRRGHMIQVTIRLKPETVGALQATGDMRGSARRILEAATGTSP